MTLKAATGLSDVVGDPYGQNIDTYRETANEIKGCLEKILKKFATSF